MKKSLEHPAPGVGEFVRRRETWTLLYDVDTPYIGGYASHGGSKPYDDCINRRIRHAGRAPVERV